MPGGDGNSEILSQFADDTALTMLAQEESFQELINVLDNFKRNTGLKANYHKTEIFRLGKTKSASKLKTTADFKWEDQNIDLLSVLLDLDKDESNYDGITNRIEAITNMWKKRNLTLIGKITMLNSLIGSLLVYKMQLIPKFTVQRHL